MTLTIKNILCAAAMLWIFMWVLMSALDKDFCQHKGFDTGYTTWDFEGHCVLDGVSVRAAEVN